MSDGEVDENKNTSMINIPTQIPRLSSPNPKMRSWTGMYLCGRNTSVSVVRCPFEKNQCKFALLVVRNFMSVCRLHIIIKTIWSDRDSSAFRRYSWFVQKILDRQILSF
eukprot:116577_1